MESDGDCRLGRMTSTSTRFRFHAKNFGGWLVGFGGGLENFLYIVSSWHAIDTRFSANTSLPVLSERFKVNEGFTDGYTDNLLREI
jgi:hypothetical protein